MIDKGFTAGLLPVSYYVGKEGVVSRLVKAKDEFVPVIQLGQKLRNHAN